MARPLQALASAGKVKIADTEYGHRLLNQMLQFPAGKLDDAVDMAALMGMAIGGGEDGAHPALITKSAPPVPKDRYDWSMSSDEGDNWKTA
jgi:hypothetical protein